MSFKKLGGPGQTGGPCQKLGGPVPPGPSLDPPLIPPCPDERKVCSNMNQAERDKVHYVGCNASSYRPVDDET